MEEARRQAEEEAGRKGGAVAAYAPGFAVPAEAAEPLVGVSRWGGIWSGFVTATALILWFALIGYGIFAPRVAGASMGSGFYIWTGIFYLVSLFIGGYIMSRLGRIHNTANAVLNGAVLWGLNFTLLLALLSIGATGVLGSILGGPIAARPVPTVGPGVATTALQVSIATAWWMVLFQFLVLLATVGGAVTGIWKTEEEAHT